MWYPLMCVRLWLTCTWVHYPMMTFPPRHTPQFCSKYFLEMSQQLLFFSWRPFQTRLGNHMQTAHQQQKGCRQASKGDQSLWVESYPISRPVQTRRREETHLKFAGWKPRESSVKIPTNCHILVIINDIHQNLTQSESSIFMRIYHNHRYSSISCPIQIYIPDLIIIQVIQALPGVSLKTTLSSTCMGRPPPSRPLASPTASEGALQTTPPVALRWLDAPTAPIPPWHHGHGCCL